MRVRWRILLGAAFLASLGILACNDKGGIKGAPQNGELGGPDNLEERGSDESWDDAAKRHGYDPNAQAGDSAVTKRKAPADAIADATMRGRVPAVSQTDMDRAFRMARDPRTVPHTPGGSRPALNHPNTNRRPSFGYPDDGCFWRAHRMVYQMKNGVTIQTYTSTTAHDDTTLAGLSSWPAKVFAFGSLNPSTTNKASGSVTWWYHVAPLVRKDGDSETNIQSYWVIDPSLSPSGPRRLDLWLSDQAASTQIAICNPNTYGPGDDCASTTAITEASSRQNSATYLDREWDRQVSLKRNLTATTGDGAMMRDGHRALSGQITTTDNPVRRPFDNLPNTSWSNLGTAPVP
jgi:hypothetical protein